MVTIEEEKLVYRGFRLEPELWEILDEHRQRFGVQSRTDALRILIRNAKVQPARVKVAETAILQPPVQHQVEPDGDIIFA